MPSRSLRTVGAVYALTGLSGIHVEALEALAAGHGLDWPGANGGLFGRRRPYMQACGDLRFLTPYALQKIGVI